LYQSLYHAYIAVYHIHLQRLETQLAVSRDGHQWQRLCEREVFLHNGEHGAFDAYWSVPTFNAPIAQDGKLLIHYGGRPDPHTTPGFGHLTPGMGGAFGLAELREDGFVSLDSTGQEGLVVTRPLQVPVGVTHIAVNACPFNTRPGYPPMRLQVEAFGHDGRCVAAGEIVSSDAAQVWHTLHLAEPLPETVRLQFRMVNGRLYSFRVGSC
jgi:hypothetical protein